jgi:hypothetical protein
VKALDSAVKKIVSATGGRIDKHEAHAAIITAGLDDLDNVKRVLSEQILKQFSNT